MQQTKKKKGFFMKVNLIDESVHCSVRDQFFFFEEEIAKHFRIFEVFCSTIEMLKKMTFWKRLKSMT